MQAAGVRQRQPMKFLSPISTAKPLAPINDQNSKKGIPVFLFKLVFEIRFSEALLAIDVIFLLHRRRRP